MIRVSHTSVTTFVALLLTTSTSEAQTASDVLREGLAVLSHDSMGGRLTGSRGSFAASSFILRTVFTLGVRPAGDKTKLTQDVPVVRVQIDSARTSLTSTHPLPSSFTYGVDYQPILGFGDSPFARAMQSGATIFGGRLGSRDAVSPASVLNKNVIFLPPLRSNGQPDYQVWNQAMLMAPYMRAKSIMLVSLDLMPATVRHAQDRWHFELKDTPRNTSAAALVAISSAAASLMLGVGADAVENNRLGVIARAVLTLNVKERAPESPTQNVAVMIEGTDPTLKSEYVVLSARLDQADLSEYEKDTQGVWPIGSDRIPNGISAASGAAALLEIARQLSKAAPSQRRTIVLLWTVGAQAGRLGSEWFAEHSLVPPNKIVASINVESILGSEPLHIVGARQLSSQFGSWVDSVGKAFPTVPTDYRLDSPGDPDRYFCTGDFWTFARRGIPSVLLTTGRLDYDAPEDLTTIDFNKFAGIAEFAGALAIDIANRPLRPALNMPKPDREARCDR